MREAALAAVLLMAATASGCRTFTDPARSHKLSNDVTWMDYDATRRGTLIVKKGNDLRVLSEPAPDVAMGVVSEFVGKASYQGISGEASAKVTETIAELGKRTETIMFLRESLFRLNEMQSVSAIEPTEVTRLYERVLDAALALAKAEQLQAAQNVDAEVAEKILAQDASTLDTILSESAAELRKQLDELLPAPAKPGVVTGQTFATVGNYADYLVRNDAEFAGRTVAGIRASGGELLRKLIAKLRPAKA